MSSVDRDQPLLRGQLFVTTVWLSIRLSTRLHGVPKPLLMIRSLAKKRAAMSPIKSFNVFRVRLESICLFGRLLDRAELELVSLAGVAFRKASCNQSRGCQNS